MRIYVAQPGTAESNLHGYFVPTSESREENPATGGAAQDATHRSLRSPNSTCGLSLPIFVGLEAKPPAMFSKVLGPLSATIALALRLTSCS